MNAAAARAASRRRLPSRFRNASAFSAGGTAISSPRRSSVSAIRAARGKLLRLLAAVGAQRPSGDGRQRSGSAPITGGEALAVHRSDLAATRVDEVGERVGQPELRRPQRALRRGSEQPRLRHVRAAGQDLGEPGERVVRGQVVLEIGKQLGELLREVVGAAVRRSRCSANVVSGSVPGARPIPRSIRPGYRPARMLNVSATLNGL